MQCGSWLCNGACSPSVRFGGRPCQHPRSPRFPSPNHPPISTSGTLRSANNAPGGSGSTKKTPPEHLCAERYQCVCRQVSSLCVDGGPDAKGETPEETSKVARQSVTARIRNLVPPVKQCCLFPLYRALRATTDTGQGATPPRAMLRQAADNMASFTSAPGFEDRWRHKPLRLRKCPSVLSAMEGGGGGGGAPLPYYIIRSYVDNMWDVLIRTI